MKSGVELPNVQTALNSEVPNICNPDRVVNLVTLYMIHHLGLSVPTFMSVYFYNPKTDHSYSKITNVYTNNHEPVALADYPNLEQAFWSVANQYNNKTEKNMRNGRNREWCEGS